MTLIIADCDRQSCRTLEEQIDFERLGISHEGTAHTRRALGELVRSVRPDIVIADVSLAVFDIMHEAKREGIPCRFIVTSPNRDDAYMALKFRVEDYLLKPLNMDELHLSLIRAADSVHSSFDMMSLAAKSVEGDRPKHIRRAVRFIEMNYDQKLTLESVAREVELNPVYLSTLFKQETGKNVKEFISQYRIRIAKELLRTSTMNINEIAVAVGYPHPRSFSKMFRQQVGINPSDYQKMYS